MIRKPAGHIVNPKFYELLRKACSSRVAPIEIFLDQECPHVGAHNIEAPMSSREGGKSDKTQIKRKKFFG